MLLDQDREPIVHGRTIEQRLSILERKAKARAVETIELNKRLKALERRVQTIEMWKGEQK